MLLRHLFFISLFSSSLAWADGWEITQSANGTTIDLYQRSSTSSDQSINNIAMTGIKSSQQLLTASGGLSLIQGASSSNNKQSINSLTSSDITGQTTQEIRVGSLSLNSDGSNNLQVGNYIQASAINHATQRFSAEKVEFIGKGSNNKQAGNYLRADKATAIQDFSANSVLYTQLGENNIQAGNIAITNNATTGGIVTQNFTSDTVTASYSEADSNGSIKAANYSTH